MSITGETAALAADYGRWHIWRGRGPSGRETDWHATGRRGTERQGERLTAPDEDSLRELLAQREEVPA